MNNIEKLLSNNQYIEAINECNISNFTYLGKLLARVTNVHLVKVKLIASWCSPEQIRDVYNVMSKGNYTWNNIQLVLDDHDVDYFVILNHLRTNTEHIDPLKTIIFHMEPNMKHNSNLGEWSNPDPDKFFRVCSHDNDYNNNEWHLKKTYSQLKTEAITKSSNTLSTVLSSKYHDIGHIKRIDFVKYLESNNFPVHVFGDNKWNYKDYKGSLPYLQKDDAMFPYKYVFNVENNNIKNYYTEKIIDAILAECLIFYSGCYNIGEYIDERAFVRLELSNFEDDLRTIKKAIEENLWEQRIVFIRKEKQKILDYLAFFPRLERIINKTEHTPYEVTS